MAGISENARQLLMVVQLSDGGDPLECTHIVLSLRERKSE
jgi:hypothetical protein